MMIDWNKVKFKVQLEATTKNDLSNKIMDVIKTVGQPLEIKYGKRKEDSTVFETATLIYGKEKDPFDEIQTIGPNLDDVPRNCFK